MKKTKQYFFVFISLALISTSAVAAEFVFSEDGTIKYADFNIVVKPNAYIAIWQGIKKIGEIKPVFQFNNKYKYKIPMEKAGKFFKNTDFKVEKNSLLITNTFAPDPNDKSIVKNTICKIKVQNFRTLNISYSHTMLESKTLAKFSAIVGIGTSYVDNLKYSVNNEAGQIHLDKNTSQAYRALSTGKVNKLKLFRGSGCEYTVIPGKNTYSNFLVFETGRIRSELFISPVRGSKTSLSLDLRLPVLKINTQKLIGNNLYTRKGIDFYKYDKLRIPNYKLSKNLVLNPSFESGLYNWDTITCYRTVDYNLKNLLVIDNSVSFKGNRSLKMTIKKGMTPPMFGPMPVVCKPGETYTYSFYAKTDKPNVTINLLGVTETWGQWHYTKGYILLSKDWKRYSYTFKTKGCFLFPVMGDFWWVKAENQVDGAHIWIDNVQLEEGELSDYTERPVQIEFIPTKTSGLFYPEELKPCKVKISAEKGSVGKVEFVLKDFFGKIISTRKKNIAFESATLTFVDVPYPKGFKSGIFLLEVNLNIGEIKDYAFFRYTILPEVPDYKNKVILGVHAGFQWEAKRMFDTLKRIGFGSIGAYHNSIGINKKRSDFLAKYDFQYIGFPIATDRDFYLKKLFYIKKEAITPEIINHIKKYVYEEVKAEPYIKIWKTLNEPDAHTKWTPDVAVILSKIIGDSIKRAKFDAVVLTPDPYNMFQSNLVWYDEYLKGGGKDLGYDAAIHIYRTRPESPDIETDTVKFFNLLKKYNYKGNVYWSEGLLHPVYVLPQLGINAHVGCVGNFFRGLSYDMGYGEKITSAYNMRYYLVGFKYANRVKMILDWSYESRFSIGLDRVPRSLYLVPNVLGRIIGDSKFVKNIDIGSNYRCYSFKNKKDFIAAAWSYDFDIDLGIKKAPLLNMSKPDTALKFTDMMGNEFIPECKNKTIQLAISSFPTFIQVPLKNKDKLVNMLENVSGVKKEFVRFKVAFQKTGEMLVSAVSKKPVPLSGKFAVKVNNTIAKSSSLANLKAFGESSIKVSLAGLNLQKNKFYNIPLNLNFTNPDVTQATKTKLPLFLLAKTNKKLIIDGEFNEFPASTFKKMPLNFIESAIPKAKKQTWFEPIKWKGKSDLSAKYKFAWNDKGLYLALQVFDDKHSINKKYLWEGDSLQIYFDTFDDGKWHARKGDYDNNDYVYGILPDLKNTIVDREVAPEFQVAFLKKGIEKHVKIKVKRKAGKTNYEIFFPKLYVNPISFKPGTSFGFALIIHDNDDDYKKRALTTTPAGTQPYKSPHLWTSFIFTK